MLGAPLFTRVSEGWPGTALWFMFFDAMKSLCLKDLRAFYVFCPVFTDFGEDPASLKRERLDFAKGKAVSCWQYAQYGKAS